jgi:hypothetical protein
MNANINEFLVELAELSKKYGIVIGGCGCCGSPHLSSLQYHDEHEQQMLQLYQSSGMVPYDEQSDHKFDSLKYYRGRYHYDDEIGA